MYCQKCGAETPDGSEFCKKCGTSLGGNTTVNKTPPAQVNKKMNFWKLLSIIFVCIEIPVVIVGIIMYFTGNGGGGLFVLFVILEVLRMVTAKKGKTLKPLTGVEGDVLLKQRCCFEKSSPDANGLLYVTQTGIAFDFELKDKNIRFGFDDIETLSMKQDKGLVREGNLTFTLKGGEKYKFCFALGKANDVLNFITQTKPNLNVEK